MINILTNTKKYVIITGIENMKNLLIVLAMLASSIVLADAPVDLDLKKDQVVSVEIVADNYYVTMFQVEKDGDTLLVNFDGLAPGTYDAVIKVREYNVRNEKFDNRLSTGKIVQQIETEIEVK